MEDNEHVATTAPEAVVGELLTPERKEELKERLDSLKSALNEAESRMNKQVRSSANISVTSSGPEETRHYLELIRMITVDARENIRLIDSLNSCDSTEEVRKNSLSLLGKAGKLYNDVLDEIGK